MQPSRKRRRDPGAYGYHAEPSRGDGSVVVWGDADLRGDSRRANRPPKSGEQKIQATQAAFAASLDDGSVVTWGVAFSGGDTSSAGCLRQLLLLASGTTSLLWPVAMPQVDVIPRGRV